MRSGARRGDKKVLLPERPVGWYTRHTLSSEPVDAEPERGWVYHEATDEYSSEGWLYHHNDATMSAEDGTVYAYTYEDAEPERGWVYHEATDEHSFEGWLYHHDDATMSAEDGTVYAYVTGEAAPSTGTVRSPDPGVPRPRTDPKPGKPPTQVPEPRHLTSDEPEPEPAPEPGPTTERAPELEPGPEPEPGSGPAPPLAPDAHPAAIPAYVEYEPSVLRPYLYALVFIAASMASMLSILRVVQDATSTTLLIASSCMAVALVACWALLDWTPTVITIKDGVLEVARGHRMARFDLRDRATQVRMGATPWSPTWAAVVQDPDGSKITIRASQVKALQFARIVHHHRGPTNSPAGSLPPG